MDLVLSRGGGLSVWLDVRVLLGVLTLIMITIIILLLLLLFLRMQHPAAGGGLHQRHLHGGRAVGRPGELYRSGAPQRALSHDARALREGDQPG